MSELLVRVAEMQHHQEIAKGIIDFNKLYQDRFTTPLQQYPNVPLDFNRNTETNQLHYLLQINPKGKIN